MSPANRLEGELMCFNCDLVDVDGDNDVDDDDVDDNNGNDDDHLTSITLSST